MSEKKNRRADVVAYLRSEYLGPAGDDEEVLADRPDRVYLVGTLYPKGPAAHRLDGEVLGDDGHDDDLDEPIELANAWHPASAAISFLHDGIELSVRVAGARYVQLADKSGWRRRPLVEPDITVGRGDEPVLVLGGAARLVSVWRPLGASWLVTIAIENTAVHDDADSPPPTAACLFQVELNSSIVNGRVLPYPDVTMLNTDEEEQELRLLYSDRDVYGVGHGCSVTWDSASSDGPRWVASEMLPSTVVPSVTAGDRSKKVLRLAYLADEEQDADDLCKDLQRFVDGYSDWVDRQAETAGGLAGDEHAAASRLVARMDSARSRMREGVELLRDDADVRVSFRFANRAMREQILQSAHMRAHKGSRGRPLPGRSDPEQEPAWYPFQLAFQLLTIASTADARHPDREVVDLIWFPTGGGKTEAYLAVAAFEMIYRRLTRGLRGGGTAVLTRYTLRMLTAQQFQRAATLICALELMREGIDRLQRTAPFSIGLWVGGDTTPNNFVEAFAQAQQLRKAQVPEGPFQIDTCPWCGTSLFPRRRSTDRDAYGVRATKYSFELFCPHESCPFNGSLPVLVVDDQIFAAPPTMLVATVDKFARVPWSRDAGAVFGQGDEPFDAPSLIIQDELHLLSGPLGTTVAVYEAAVLSLIGWSGRRPKVIASTATIRSASEQVRRLYGADVALFPPSGLSANDSYFAEVDHNLPGRLYLGLMPQAHTQSFATVLACVALLQAPKVVTADPADLDDYWTVVAYHNSLRELGRTVTIARDDVESMLTARADDPTREVRRMRRDGVIELTSNVRPGQLTQFIARLERGVENEDAVDLVATTNMLSVGVDISRLGLMLMNGQPKTTAEYIQATSRVGRSKVPGLVVTLLRASKPRDRSHYESFRAFHESIYRHVEPTSVTPWSTASRERSLHAALVMLVRHGAGLRANDAAGDFHATDPPVLKAMGLLLAAVERAEPEARDATRAALEGLVAFWERRARDAEAVGGKLRYQSSSADHPALLRDFGERRDGWPTMHSMRSVDRQVRIMALGEQG
jgi:hypothetical protein